MSIQIRLEELGFKIPSPAMPLANYLPYKLVGDKLYLSGMIPLVEGKPICTGKLGDHISVEQGQECARVCAMNALGWLNTALDGQLDRVVEVVRICGFVASAADFYEHPAVINGASDLMVDVFGERGRHTRAVVGSVSLPLNVPVEIDFLFRVELT